MKIQDMKNIDISTVDPNTLRDIRDTQTDENLPHLERKRNFVRQIINPYCFLVDGVIVKLSFPEHAPSLTNRLESLLTRA